MHFIAIVSTSEVQIPLWKATSTLWIGVYPSFGHGKKALCCWLVVSSFSPLFVGEDVQIWLIFFQMGWNHQLGCFVTLKMKTCKTMGFKRKKQKDCICTIYIYIHTYIYTLNWRFHFDKHFELHQKSSWVGIHTWIVIWDIRIPSLGSITYPLPQEPGPAAELETTSTVKQKRWVFERPFLHVGSWYLCFAINHFAVLQQWYNGFMSYFLQR